MEAMPWGIKERLTYEKTAVGFYLSGHLFDEVALEVRRFAKRQIDDLMDTREPQLLAGIVTDFRVINGQRGKLALFKLDDKSGVIEARADEALINRAYVYSVVKHGTQKRASGDPYFSHPVEVAGLMTELKLDQETIITALLHDTVEDTLATIEEIERLFGPEVARLVDGVTKLSKIEQMPEDERAAENLRKFLLAMSEDLQIGRAHV